MMKQANEIESNISFLFVFRASNSNRISIDSNSDCDKPPRLTQSVRQVHPVCEEKAQILAYDKRSNIDKVVVQPRRPTLELNGSPPPYPKRASLESNPSPTSYPLTPNICVEAGRIEFIKPSVDGENDSVRTPPSTPKISGRITVTRGLQTSDDEEKFDDVKVGGVPYFHFGYTGPSLCCLR